MTRCQGALIKMSNIIEKHLEGVTVENMNDFRSEAFTMYASARGIKLGFNAYGNYQVKTGGDTYNYDTPAEAIEKYSELVRE